MTTLLVSIGIIVAFAVIFWLDRNQGPEPTPAIIHLFDILRNFHWDMDEDDIRNSFLKFSKTSTINLRNKSTLSVKEHDGPQEILTTFSFSNDIDGKVNLAQIKLSRIARKDIDLLFRTVCKQYGQPEKADSGTEGAVKWSTEPGVLTLENTAPEEYTLTVKEEKIEDSMV